MERIRAGMRARIAWAVASSVVLAACGGDQGGPERVPDLTSADRMGGMGVVCSNAGVEILNPFVAPDLLAYDLRLLLFTPLVLYSDTGFRPHLAEEWEWDREQRSLRLGLRTDMVWHDGQPVTAEDVAWTLRAAANPEYAYWAGADFEPVDEVVVIDASTVMIRFSVPFVAGLEPFVSLPILPRHLLAEVPAAEFARADYNRSPIGSGPYRLADRNPDGSMVFERFSDYPDDLGPRYLDRIVFRAIPEPTTLATELQTGGVDLCLLGGSVAERVSGSDRIELLVAEPTGVQVFPLNLRHPPLDDARVRRALSAALRRSDIAAVISPIARPARTFLPPSSPYLAAELRQPDNDSALAVRLLEEAGWKDDGGSVRRNARGDALRITVVAPAVLEPTLTVVQEQLRRVGVELELRLMEAAAYFSMIRDPERRPDMMALAFFPEKVLQPDPYSELHSTGNSNLSFYSNPVVDSLVERLQLAVEPEERGSIYRELQRRVAEDIPVIYTVYSPRPVGRTDRIRDVRIDLNGVFSNVGEWWIPPDRRRRG